jgi:hypothetical protein
MFAVMTPASLVAKPYSHADVSVSVDATQNAQVPANYDIRWEIAAERAGKIAVDPSRERAIGRMSESVKGFTLHTDDASGLPKMVTTIAPGARLSGPLAAKASNDPVAAARTFLRSNADVYGLKAADLETAKVRYVSAPKGDELGATIVRFEQCVGSTPVFGAEIAVVFSSKDLSVAGTSGTLYPDAAVGVATKNRALTMRDAFAVAASDLAGRVFASAEFAEADLDDAGYRTFEYTPDRNAGGAPVFGYNLRAREVLFPIAAGETIPAYYAEVTLEPTETRQSLGFSFVVSAEDGRILFRNNLSADEAYTYLVFADVDGNFRPFNNPNGMSGFPHPTGIPDGFQGTAAFQNYISIESLLGPTDPWLPAGATVTTGNNVEAYLDVSGADGFTANDIRGQITAAGEFNAPFNPAFSSQDASVRQSKAVHMFYYNNWLHDVWYQKGFDEASGNAQTDNYGRGGAANDSIKGEGEDGRGTNNANMLTPADGSRPRMQMYRFTAPEPDRDSSTDFGIVAHEWMHYMSNRLVGNANGLNNQQGGSMGEGWGDWNGLMMSVREGYDLDGVYTTGAWCTVNLWSNYLDNYYYGIRRFPYSTRMDRNPQTFADIGPGQAYPAEVPRNTNVGTTPSEVHNAGEVWSQMLWEGSVAIMKAYGITAGRDRMMRYVADGMKATPSSPTYGQARDGVIMAANAIDSYDVSILWQAFSKRGIGEGSISPTSSSTNHSGITESYVAPTGMPDDTVGIYAPSTFFERNSLVGGNADLQVNYGGPTLTPLAGNWNGGAAVGAESADTVGGYDPATGNFFLRYTNGDGPADVVFSFGAPGLKPIAGDWNGDGTTTVGVYDPATGNFFLKNSNAGGAADVVFSFGAGGVGFLPIAGDWNGDGVDSIGLYNPATGDFFLKNSNAPGAADMAFNFGGAGGFAPIAGDWNSDGTDTVGIYGLATGSIFLKNTTAAGGADRVYSFGPVGGMTAFAGNFDGQ